MKLLWTKSSTPLSVLIRSVTGEPCSHFSFVFESAAKGLMFESNLFGTHPAFLQTAMKNHTIVHEKALPITIEQEDLLWDVIVQKYDAKSYDFGGALYLGKAKLENRAFKTPIPIINAWASDDKYFCEEIVEILQLIPGFPKIENPSMKTPEDLWQTLKDWELVCF